MGHGVWGRSCDSFACWVPFKLFRGPSPSSLLQPHGWLLPPAVLSSVPTSAWTHPARSRLHAFASIPPSSWGRSKTVPSRGPDASVTQLPPGDRRTPQALVKMSGLCSENTFAALSRARPGPQHLSRQNVLCADITSDGPPIGSGTKGTCPLGWQLEAPASGQRKGSLSHT